MSANQNHLGALAPESKEAQASGQSWSWQLGLCIHHWFLLWEGPTSEEPSVLDIGVVEWVTSRRSVGPLH